MQILGLSGRRFSFILFVCPFLPYSSLHIPSYSFLHFPSPHRLHLVIPAGINNIEDDSTLGVGQRAEAPDEGLFRLIFGNVFLFSCSLFFFTDSRHLEIPIRLTTALASFRETRVAWDRSGLMPTAGRDFSSFSIHSKFSLSFVLPITDSRCP